VKQFSPFHTSVETLMQSPLVKAYVTAWERSFEYAGRSNRGDYWWFVLANFIVLFVLNLLGTFVGFFALLANLYLIAQFVPHLPLAIRRLRDAGKDWQWIFVCVTGIGALWVLYLHTLPSAGLLAG
jgi:uncharacterized membrane protein YhaH (DUF805 family)